MLVENLKEEGLKPRYLSADKAFDDACFRAELAQEGIQAYIPCRRDLGHLARQGFTCNFKTRRLRCPTGRTAIGRAPHQRGGYLFYFSEMDCGVCPIKDRCLKKTGTRKRVYLKPEVFAHRPRGIKRAMRIRKTIERVFGEVKTWHGLYQAR